MTVNMIIKALIYVLLAPFIGGLLSGTDRVFAARMQGRQGPPLIQPFYDVNKLLHKQTTVVNSIQVLFVTVYLIFTIYSIFTIKQDKFINRQFALDFPNCIMPK